MTGFDDLLAEFWTVAKERLDRIDPLLDTLQAAPDTRTARNNLDLELHSLAGEANLMGQTKIAEVARRMESILSDSENPPSWDTLRERAAHCRTFLPTDSK